MRTIEFFLLVFYFYCNIIVLNVAQTATIAKLGLGIIHTHILATLYYDLRKLELDIVQDEALVEKKNSINNIFQRQKYVKYVMIVFFFATILSQSIISYDPYISIRFEFGLQSFFYFVTLISMIVFTRKLVRTIRSIFGNNNAEFDAEIK